MVFRAKNRGEIYTIENLLVERLGGGVARLNDYKERGCTIERLQGEGLHLGFKSPNSPHIECIGLIQCYHAFFCWQKGKNLLFASFQETCSRQNFRLFIGLLFILKSTF